MTIQTNRDMGEHVESNGSVLNVFKASSCCATNSEKNPVDSSIPVCVNLANVQAAEVIFLKIPHRFSEQSRKATTHCSEKSSARNECITVSNLHAADI